LSIPTSSEFVSASACRFFTSAPDSTSAAASWADACSFSSASAYWFSASACGCLPDRLILSLLDNNSAVALGSLGGLSCFGNVLAMKIACWL